ncbi:hypothetical protein AB0230_12275 [Microbacterium sp. NPDC089190]|uniref:hypothetical protein n=1 Tax=Microbacterium sp. NPDC089190 TaxID=3155063 RepID=UPI00344F1C1F
MAVVGRDREEIENGIVQLRFVGDDGHTNEIGAYELAQALEGLVDLTKELNKTGEFGAGVAPDLRIRPPREGSFILEAMVWVNENPITGVGLGLAASAATAGAVAAGKEIGTAAGKAIVNAVGTGLKSLRGETPAQETHRENGDVELSWADGTSTVVQKATWVKLQEMKRPTRRALQKLLTPLNDEATSMEIRDASPNATTEEILALPAEATARREDYLDAIAEPDDAFEKERIFETEASIRSLDFDNNRRWRVETTKEGTRQATIEDVDFLRTLDKPGQAIHKNDVFWLKIREVTSKERGRNASKDWIVIEVKRTKRGEVDGGAEDPPANDED